VKKEPLGCKFLIFHRFFLTRKCQPNTITRQYYTIVGCRGLYHFSLKPQHPVHFAQIPAFKPAVHSQELSA